MTDSDDVVGRIPTLEDLEAAAERIGPYVHRTPVATCASLDRLAGASLHFKCENLQKVGAFKARGATNAVLALPAEAARHGVATHSSGNHAAAVARAAAIRGVPAHIVMPVTAPRVKRASVVGYGGEITECAATLAAREATLAEVVARTGAAFIHPYDDPVVVAGQGTAALELLQQVAALDAVIAPVGGGGLASGTCIAAAEASSTVEVYGAEPEAADDAFRSLRDGRRYPSEDPDTVADGLRTALSELTFEILRRHVTEVLTVSEQAIIDAMRLLWERAKLLVEPSAAVALAVILENPQRFARRRVGVILSGGNVDLDRLPF
jgi:threonine dehydratase